MVCQGSEHRIVPRLMSDVVEVVLGRNDSVLPLLGRANHALAQAGLWEPSNKRWCVQRWGVPVPPHPKDDCLKRGKHEHSRTFLGNGLSWRFFQMIKQQFGRNYSRFSAVGRSEVALVDSGGWP